MSGLARAAAALAVLAAAAMLAWALGALGIGLDDNNDGWRVLDKAMVDRVHGAAGRPVQAAYPMLPLDVLEPARLAPDSLSGLVALALAGAARLAGLAEFRLFWLSLAYATAFLAGVALLWASLRGAAARGLLAVATAGFLLCPLAVGFFRSLYQEAALIAVFPLWAWAALWAAREPRGLPWLAATTVAAVYAKPAALLLGLPFAALLLRHGLRGGRGWLALPVAAAVGLGLLASGLRYGEMNAVNRLYNGLGWSLAGVADWPERDHLARLAAAPGRVDDAGFARSGLDADLRPAWGRTYWPHVRDLPPERRAELAAPGRLPAYATRMAADPGLLAAVLAQSWSTAVRADYRLGYLHPGPLAPGAAAALARLGWLLPGAALLLALALARGRLAAAALMLPLVLAPGFVVVGDGYYELEKHLLPFLLIGLFAAPAWLALMADPRPRAAGARA